MTNIDVTMMSIFYKKSKNNCSCNDFM